MNELYHYGVKGQKWGVRRYQNKDGSLTPAGKKRLNKEQDTDEKKKKLTTAQKVAIGVGVTASILAITGGVVYAHKKKSYLSSIDMKSIKRGKYAVDLMSKDTIIPKGDSIFRTSTSNKLRDELTYASLKNDDKNRYIIRMANQYSKEKLYQLKIKTLTDIKIPSEKKQFDMFVDLLTNDESFSKKVTYNPYGKTTNVFGNRKLAEQFASEYHYENFVTRAINLGTKYDKDDTLSSFVKYAKSKGYNGLLDINDIGTTSEKPIMVFDSNDNLLVESARKLNAGMKFVAGLKLKNV